MTTYIDCGSGVAGDMLIGAMIDLGLSVRDLDRALHKVIPMSGWRLEVNRTERQGWPARTLMLQGDRPFGSPAKMKAALRKASLPERVKTRALRILNTLEWAEADAHNSPSGDFDPEGLGLLDTFVDVLGASWGFWKLGIEEATASPVNTGRIAPASARIIARADIPSYSTSSAHELATPTGIAILSCMVTNYGPMPTLLLERTGYGAGTADFSDRPNVLAIHRGRTVRQGTWSREPVLLLETVIDDMDPRLYPHVSDLLMKAGALDLWWSSIGMKKGRPGIAFSVLCRPADEPKLVEILFRETTTLGLRRLPIDRWVLPRRRKDIYKIAILPHGETKAQTEYEEVRKVAGHSSIPLRKLLK